LQSRVDILNADVPRVHSAEDAEQIALLQLVQVRKSRRQKAVRDVVVHARNEGPAAPAYELIHREVDVVVGRVVEAATSAERS
jgi:hypothetical protein